MSSVPVTRERAVVGDAARATGAVPGLPRPGSAPSWQVTAARAAATTAGVLTFGIIVQWPLRSDPMLLASNLVVSVGFACGSVLVSDETRHAPTRRAFLAASLLWSIAWVNEWEVAPLPFVASLVGPLPELLAIWGLLQFPRPWRTRRAATAILALLTAMQAVGMATALTNVDSLQLGTVHSLLQTIYNEGGAVCTVLLGGLFVARTIRLRGHELRITVPIAIAVMAGAIATSFSDAAAGAGGSGQEMWDIYAIEGLLLALVPLSFIASYVLRRFSIESLAGRVGPYDALPQAQDTLRRALRDPTLEIHLAVSDGRWVDADGIPTSGPAARAGLQVPVTGADGHRVAVVSADASLDRFADLLAGAAQSLHLVLENARLVAQLRDDLALAQDAEQRLAIAVDAERRQIRHRASEGPLTLAQQAHRQLDHAIAGLVATGRVPKPLDDAKAMVAHAVDDIRLLSNGEEPLGLRNGLADAVTRAFARNSSVDVQVSPLRAGADVERVAYFMILEAVGNAVKYAGAGAHITVAVAFTDNPERGARRAVQNGGAGRFLLITVSDDGPGGADPSGHGLSRMAEQIASVGGTLDARSVRGTGTTVRAALPRALSGPS